LLAEVERLRVELAASRAQVKQLAATADIDSLTEVFNRRGFERELKRSLNYVRRYGTNAALFYVDLDGFKPVNDQHGHAAGDAMLKAVASVLTRRVRASDTVARLGGDEFALILWNLNETAAAAKARALEDLVAGLTVDWDGATLPAAASIGVAMLTAFDEPADALARADYAMYARKAERRGNSITPRQRS
jgi:diguanylate cyclase (GGDEF)-like protein